MILILLLIWLAAEPAPPSSSVVEWAKVFLSAGSPAAALGILYGAWRVAKSGKDIWLQFWREQLQTEEFRRAVNSARENAELTYTERIHGWIDASLEDHESDVGSHRLAIDHQVRNLLNQTTSMELMKLTFRVEKLEQVAKEKKRALSDDGGGR